MEIRKASPNWLMRTKRKVQFKYSRRQNMFVAHPVIRLSGKYLEQLGFYIGDEIELRFENGQIIITKLVPVPLEKKKQKPDKRAFSKFNSVLSVAEFLYQ